jgi:hypothetical protein
MTVSNFQKLIDRATEAAGLKIKAHPHMLRHACGFALANAGKDTRALQAYLGHKNIQHTVRYSELRGSRADAWPLQGKAAVVADISERLLMTLNGPRPDNLTRKRLNYSFAQLSTWYVRARAIISINSTGLRAVQASLARVPLWVSCPSSV